MIRRFSENLKAALMLLGLAFGVYLIFGFLLLPPIVRYVLQSKLAESLDREVTIERVKINPISFGITIEGLNVNEREAADEKFLSFEELFVNLQLRSVVKRGLTLKEFRIEKPYVNITRLDAQKFNFSDLIAKEKPSPGTESEEGRTEDDEKKGFPFSINNIQIIDGSADFSDLPMKKNHRVRELTITIPFISSLPPEVGIFVKPSFSAKINDTEFDMGGNTKPFTETQETTLEVKLSELSIPHYAAYSPVPLDFDFVSGALSVDMYLSYMQFEDAKPSLTLSGTIRLADIAIEDHKGLPMVKLPLFKVDVAPSDLVTQKIRVSEVLIDGPSISALRRADGKINAMALIPAAEKKGKKAKAKKGAAGAADIEVERVVVRNGRALFMDRSVKPSYRTELKKIGVEVSGLTSSGERARVYIKAVLDGYAPFEIRGKVDPLAEDLFVDLKILFKDFSLSSVSPYTGKYIGNNIEKGKLFLDLEYLIDKRKLTARNDLLIDNIALGERVESKDATKLPVGLALNLLKDRDGLIDIKLPVEGSLDDPEFSVFGIAIRMFVNLIVKAATAPFSVLGAIIGGGEELSYVEFKPASFLITEAEAEKLTKLADALYERPNIKIEVAGYVDMEADTESLRQERFLGSLKAQKFKRLKRMGRAPASIEEVVIADKEFEKYLWLAYKKTEFEKEKSVLGLTKKLEPAEMERLMLKHIEIIEDDLRGLVRGRAAAVKDVLLASEKIEAGRVFIVWPDALEPEMREGLANARVEFKLK